jgi:hypothetical protein
MRGLWATLDLADVRATPQEARDVDSRADIALDPPAGRRLDAGEA